MIASRRLHAALVRRWLAFRWRTLDRRYGRLSLEQIVDVPLLVLPDVFNPVLLRSGVFLAHAVQAEPLPPGSAVLDLGTGSGVGAIFAARRGMMVTAVDINPEAVRCVRINALLNRVEERVTAVPGDLFQPLADQQFDLVVFNPPFYRGQPRDKLDHAWRGSDVFERFAAGLAGVLRPGGKGLLILSSDGDGQQLLDLLANAGFTIEIAHRQDMVNEIQTAYRLLV